MLFSLLGVLVVLLVLFVLLFCLLLGKEMQLQEQQTQIDSIENIPDEEPLQEEGKQTLPSDEQTEEEQTENYLPPSYEFDTSSDEVSVKIPGLSRSYRIAWISDLHMITDLEPADDVFEEHIETLKNRHDLMFVTQDGIPSEELWPQIISYLLYYDFDGIVFGGDILDYCSKSNLETFLEGYNRLLQKYEKDKILYVRADHDYGSWYGGEVQTEWRAHELHAFEIDGREVYDPLDEYDRILDFGEFAIIGVDGSTKNMSGDQLEVIANRFAENKPVVIATHVPYEPRLELDRAQLAELSMQVRGKIYYWSEDSEHYAPLGRTLDYYNYLYAEDSPVKQVLSGHLHHVWDGMLTEQLPEHIFTPAYLGAIGIIEVTP